MKLYHITIISLDFLDSRDSIYIHFDAIYQCNHEGNQFGRDGTFYCSVN